MTGSAVRLSFLRLTDMAGFLQVPITVQNHCSFYFSALIRQFLVSSQSNTPQRPAGKDSIQDHRPGDGKYLAPQCRKPGPVLVTSQDPFILLFYRLLKIFYHPQLFSNIHLFTFLPQPIPSCSICSQRLNIIHFRKNCPRSCHAQTKQFCNITCFCGFTFLQI